MNLQIVETIVLIIHVLTALSIIGLVLIQQGKGADMGSGFGGGASGTVFGSVGSGNFLTRTTTVLAVTFFITSFSLAYFAKEHSLEAQDIGIPSVTKTAAAKPSQPAANKAAAATKAQSTSEVPETTAPSGDSEVPKQ